MGEGGGEQDFLNFDLQKRAIAETGIDKSSEQVIQVLFSDSDAVFRSGIDQIRNNPPKSMANFTLDKDQHRKSKFDHTLQALQIIETDELETRDTKFIARAAMLFHDTDPSDMALDLTEWVDKDLISNEVAIKVAQFAWKHDFLGENINSSYAFSEEIFKILPEENDREVLYAILMADIKANFSLQPIITRYEQEIEKLRNMTPPTQELRFSVGELSERQLVDSEVERTPQTNEVFTNAIFDNTAFSLKERTVNILTNIITGGSLRSLSMVSRLEQGKTGVYDRQGGATNDRINVSRFSTAAPGNGSDTFSRQDLSMCCFAMRGKDLEGKCLVRNLFGLDTPITEISSQAALVTQFNTEGLPVGGEVSTEDMYFMVDMRGMKTLGNIIKLQAIRENVNPREWAKKRIVLYGEDGIDQTARMMAAEIFDPDELIRKSEKVFIESLEKQVLRYSPEQVNLSSVVQSASADIACETVNDFNPTELVENIRAFIDTYGSISNIDTVSGIVEKLKQQKRIIEMVKKEGNHYDSEREILYLSTNYDGTGVVAIPGISEQKVEKSTFTRRNSNMIEDDHFTNEKWSLRDANGQNIDLVIEKVAPSWNSDL